MKIAATLLVLISLHLGVCSLTRRAAPQVVAAQESPAPSATLSMVAETPLPEPTLDLQPEAFTPQDGAVSWSPMKLVNGSPCVFRVRPDVALTKLSGTFMGKPVQFAADASGAWFALAGVDYDAKPGSYTLALEGVTAAGQRKSFTQSVPVSKGFYRTTALTVAKKFIEPDAETLKRIQREKEIKAEAFRTVSPARLWSGTFAAPVKTSTSAEYGSQRTYNGVRQSVHQGLDFRAGTGTPVMAANGGRVVLAQDLFFEGNCIVLDHGQGLLTLYLHLSEFKVKEGDQVERGQLIGLSGGTGRVTGPHLHWAVRWHGLYLDPATLLKLELPTAKQGTEHAGANR
jgi:murein DD-endopeptidase MepM/ murein hydrolase activator NlpD